MQTQNNSYEVKFYKNKYLISLYDEDDFIVGTFNTCREVAKFLNKTIGSTFCSIGRCLEGKTNSIIGNDNLKSRYTVYFTDVSEEMDDLYCC